MRLTLPCALILLCCVVRAAPVDSLIQATDLLKINLPASPALSPDGKRIAYVVRGIETSASGEHTYVNRLWLASSAGDVAPRELSPAGSDVRDPVWHPAGDRIAFVRHDNAILARIWVMPVEGGAPYAVTPPMRGIASPRWSPDGTRLLFTAVVGGSGQQASVPQRPAALPPRSPAKPAPTATAEAAPATASSDDKKQPAPEPDPDGTSPERLAWLERNVAQGDPIVATELELSPLPAQETATSFVHVFVINRAGAAPIDLTPGNHSRLNPTWLPDGRRIVCSGSEGAVQADQVRQRGLFILEADGGEPRPLLTSIAFSLDHPVASPDGKWIACLARPAVDPGDLLYGQTRVAVIDVENPNPQLRILTDKLDRSAERPRWSPDGKFIYFTAETNGGAPLHRIPAQGGNHERITSTDTWVVAHDVGSKDLAVVIARPGNPGELYRTNPGGRAARILTTHNSEWLREKRAASPERRKRKRPDGVEIEYWVVKPPYLEGGFHYPLLVMIHDGPGAMWGPANPDVWHEIQYFAARGYGVVFANPRGSSGYGQKFQRSGFRDWGPGPAGDVLIGANAIARESWVDEERQVILGRGYGAYLAAWIVSHESRFKAGILAGGIYDLTTFFGESDAWPHLAWHFGGPHSQPEIRKLLEAQSPHTRVNSIHTPLLIKQNEADRRSVAAQGEMLYRSLKRLERPVEFVRYPNAPHSLAVDGNPAQRIDRLVRFDAFFQRHVGMPAKLRPPPPLPPVQPAPAPSTPPAPTAPVTVPTPAKPKPDAEPKNEMAPEGMMMMSP